MLNKNKMREPKKLFGKQIQQGEVKKVIKEEKKEVGVVSSKKKKTK